MGWETRHRIRRYFYTNRWIKGASRKLYVGRRLIGELAAERALQRRLDVQTAREELRAMQAVQRRLTSLLDQLGRVANLLGWASLLVAGFHQHARGEWRRRRVAS